MFLGGHSSEKYFYCSTLKFRIFQTLKSYFKKDSILLVNVYFTLKSFTFMFDDVRFIKDCMLEDKVETTHAYDVLKKLEEAQTCTSSYIAHGSSKPCN